MEPPRRSNPEFPRYIVMQMLRRTARPLLPGPLALELGVSLAEAEKLLEEMVYAGLLRKTTPRENSAYDILGGFLAAV